MKVEFSREITVKSPYAELREDSYYVTVTYVAAGPQILTHQLETLFDGISLSKVGGERLCLQLHRRLREYGPDKLHVHLISIDQDTEMEVWTGDEID